MLLIFANQEIQTVCHWIKEHNRLKRKIPKARFLFLSAVVPRETLEDFAHWLNADIKEDIIEGNYLLENEDTQKAADNLVNWEQMGDVKNHTNYVRRIKRVDNEEIRKVIKKYFSKKNYCLAIIEGN